MNPILPPAAVPLPDAEPTTAELDVIDTEMPLVRAEVELLDVEIALLDRVPTELDLRRWRRHLGRVLDARRDLTNRANGHSEVIA
ncbi:DUF6284 family protein [Streptomyces sp. TRM 70351]|uniref:DUF6284 family protein n=1 Tax=Streptomyces sp. TRM 70351 TaxID=3116552 RepID=UPI002E7B42AD|nr:DUF6284 family protein [Streptomyces sp. TRM 70351]MEE1929842.1 DUF6284 family protein [Streptomyces sp. TRM 70351]